MSHSYDSTLLQRMGFRDSDRKTPEHDRACIAIATKPQSLIAALGLRGLSTRAFLEQPLQKGDGKYASTVGFIDVVVSWNREFDVVDCKTPHRENPFRRCDKCTDAVMRHLEAVVVEVKTRIDGVGDLLRQMNLYREYAKGHHREWGEVTQYAIWSLDRRDSEFRELLEGQGYRLLVGPEMAG